MKKGLLSLLCCSLILVLCGCNDETLKKEENNKVSTTNSCKLSTDVVFSYNNFKCPEMKDIKYNGDGFFITNGGELFEYSERKYSTTETNCKLIESDVKFDKIVRNTLIGENEKLYRFEDSKVIPITDQDIIDGRAYYGINQMEGEIYQYRKDIFYLRQIDPEAPEIYGYIENNNVYSLSYNWSENKYNSELLYTLEENEKILYTSNGYLVTTKGYYRYEIINKKECNEYADIECTYGLKLVDTYENCSNSVIYIGDGLIVKEEMFK